MQPVSYTSAVVLCRKGRESYCVVPLSDSSLSGWTKER